LHIRIQSSHLIIDLGQKNLSTTKNIDDNSSRTTDCDVSFYGKKDEEAYYNWVVPLQNVYDG